MLRNPIAVDRFEFFVDGDVRAALQRVENAGDIPRVDRAAGARAALVVVELDSAEHGNALALADRQGLAVVFEQHAALRDGLPRQSGVAVEIKCIRIHLASFLSVHSGRRKGGRRRLRQNATRPAGFVFFLFIIIYFPFSGKSAQKKRVQKSGFIQRNKKIPRGFTFRRL